MKKLAVAVGLVLFSCEAFADDNCIVGDCVNGQGTMISADGAKYVGEFKNGTLTGQGVLDYSDGRKYEGEFKNGKREGLGVYTKTSETNYIENGKRITPLPNNKYEGEFKNNKFVKGTLTEAIGTTFETKYEGEFRGNELTGQGVKITRNGKYEAIFSDGMLHGQGVASYIDENGKEVKYEGEFGNDTIRRGTKIFSNGDKYEGEFWKGIGDGGKPHGQGTMTYTDGTIKTGKWKKGEFIGK